MKKEYYDPKTNKFPYTERTDGHYLVVKKDKGIKFDGDYPYIDDGRRFLRKRAVTRFLLKTVVFPLTRIKMGLKIGCRENLKKFSNEIKNGAVSVSNHVHMWDYIAVMKAISPVKPYVLSWAKNINGENGDMIRSVGGVPIPEGDLSGTLAYLRAVYKMLDSGGWLHVCAEGSMWEYYAPVRPFKKGAATIACKTGKPILPLGFSYRKPSLLGRLFGRIADIDLTVGEPLYANEDLPLKERIEDLTVRAHRAVCKLCGIEPENNIYPPLFNDNKRIDY